jgi:prolyl 4-hydroxylase
MILSLPLQNHGLTVQDRPHCAPPIYNGVNPSYPGLRALHTSPPLFVVDHFLTDVECDFLVHSASDSFGPAPVVGRGSGELSPSRTSSTCYLAREDVPDLLRKVSWLTGKPMEHCELPQVGRYLTTQQYMQHYDAFDLGTEDGQRFALNGGQRVVTVLIYLNDVPRGGATHFPCLNLDVQPRKGTAVVFFPATVDGALDKSALHAALPAVDTKYVSQVWIRQGPYSGMPSKRLAAILGAPLSVEEVQHNRRVCSVGTAAAAAALAATVSSAAASAGAAGAASVFQPGPLVLAPFAAAVGAGTTSIAATSQPLPASFLVTAHPLGPAPHSIMTMSSNAHPPTMGAFPPMMMMPPSFNRF